MGSIEIEAPGIVTYRVNRCPICGDEPQLHVDILSSGKEKITYRLRETVTCTRCGIIAPLSVWNALEKN